MALSDWLDEREAENVDISKITVPKDLLYDASPDELVFFKEIKDWIVSCAYVTKEISRLKKIIFIFILNHKFILKT